MGEAAQFDIPNLKERMLRHLGEHKDAYPTLLEQRFPHILAKLVELWGTAAGDAYIQSLMVTDRAYRQGFPMEIASEVFRLSRIHDGLNSGGETGNSLWSQVASGESQDYFDRRANR